MEKKMKKSAPTYRSIKDVSVTVLFFLFLSVILVISLI